MLTALVAPQHAADPSSSTGSYCTTSGR
jgi:hypothetical protein